MYSQSVNLELNENDAYSYFKKGYACINKGKIDSALIYFTSTTDYYQKTNNKTYLAPAYVNLGIVYKLYGDYVNAIKFYDKAENLFKEINKIDPLVSIYLNKANIFEIQKDYKKSEQYYLKTLVLLNQDSIANKARIASLYNNLGILYRNTGNNNQAIDYFLKSISLKNSNDKLYNTFGNLALSYEKMKLYNDAERYYLKALENIKQQFGNNNVWYALAELNYGTFLINKKNDTINSITHLANALLIYQSVYGEKSTDLSFCYNRIGEYYLVTHDYKNALISFQKSLVALAENFNDTTDFTNPDIHSVLSKPHLLRTLKNKTKVLKLLSENTTTKNNYLQAALESNIQAIEVLKQLRTGYLSEESKLYLAGNESDIYNEAIETCYSLFKTSENDYYIYEAFKFAELSKATILAEAMQNNSALIHGNIPQSIINDIATTDKKYWMTEELIYEEKRKPMPDHNKIDNWNNLLFELSETKALFTEKIEKNYPEYYRLKYDSSNVDLKRIQKLLHRNDVIIEYSLGSSSLFTFVITKNKYYLHFQPIDSVFYHAIDTLILSVAQNNLANHTQADYMVFKKTSFALYNYLIKPIANYLNHKELIIIPDQKLAYIPFEVLIKENSDENSLKYNALPYLLFDNPISYSYSAKLYSDNNHRKKSTGHKLIALAPEYKNQETLNSITLQTRQQYREKLFPLKGTKEEAIKIAQLLNGDTLLNENASEYNFKKLASDYDILHLAMHTILNDKDPMFSKMAFSVNNDSIEDGFLNTFEVYNLNLNCRMAVLSSCNTGSGLLNKGEGVMSLARGFIYAGCPSIIMTLWTVEDKSGVKLMVEFYRSLMKGNNKAKSLQKAKINFLENADPLKSHPYYWSGYVAIGNKLPLFSNQYSFLVLSLLVGAGLLFIIIRKFKK
ncbi:MAG: CHAT domain-containing protein [Bacteroidales bacterium]